MNIGRYQISLPCSLKWLLICFGVLALLSACGGGGGGGQSGGSVSAPSTPVVATPPDVVPTPVPQTAPTLPVPLTLWRPENSATPPSGNYVYLVSDKADATNLVPDFIGAGGTYLYAEANPDAETYFRVVEGVLMMQIVDKRQNLLWAAEFAGMSKMNPLQPGYYSTATRYPFQTGTESGMSISHSAIERGCNQLQGWFAVDKIEYVAGKISALDLRFEQHCDNKVVALRGKIHWTFDTTPAPPPGPLAIPSDLWRADATKLPTGPENYVYMENDIGDNTLAFDPGPFQRLFTKLDSIITVEPLRNSNGITIKVDGDHKSGGQFVIPARFAKLQPGLYDDIGPAEDTERGYMLWSDSPHTGSVPGGNLYKSWLIIDSVTYSGDVLTAISLRFNQHGQGRKPAFRGQVRWSATDSSSPPGPINPPPALWMPPADAMPASGNAVYLQSDKGDFIGQGATLLYTSANATFATFTQADGQDFRVQDIDGWFGMFTPPKQLPRLVPGYYGGLLRTISMNPTKGGLDWHGHARGCIELNGWFVVDRVVYTGNEMTTLELRFEQHCEGAAPALRGAIRWAK